MEVTVHSVLHIGTPRPCQRETHAWQVEHLAAYILPLLKEESLRPGYCAAQLSTWAVIP